jgi:hypothetical protein
MPDELLASVREVAEQTDLSQQDVMRQAIKAGLSKVREQFGARVTNVEPLSDAEWVRIYSRRDELDGVSARRLSAFQSQKEPD